MFDGLPQPPRRYLPAALRVDRLADVEACYGELAARALPADDPWTLQQWLVDWSELESHLAEDHARKQIAACRRADDIEAVRAHLELVDVLAPRCKPLRDALTRRLLAHPAADRLPAATHACALRTLRARAALFHRELAPLEAAEQHLRAEYQRLRADLTLPWDGAARPLDVVERAQDDPDPDRREAAWRAAAARMLAAKPALDDLFDRLLANRRAQAAAAGQPDYRAYRFRQLGRVDYGPAECAALHAAIEGEFAPLAAAVLDRRAADRGLPTARPWDLALPLDVPRPFVSEEALIAGCAAALDAVDPELGRQFAWLAGQGLLDLMSRPGKAAGGFQATLEASGLPFVFANATGRHDDVLTVLHESGHAFHALACARDPLIWNRSPPLELCEFAGQAMELLAGAHLHAFYPADVRPQVARRQIEQLALFLPFCAALDAFQHWLYAAPASATDPPTRDAAWQALHRRMLPAVDWSGLEDICAAGWQRKLHVFEVPFYYLEYAIAGVAALHLHARYLDDPAPAVAAYRRALALGARAPLPTLFAAAGLPWPIDRAAVRRAADHCRALLAL